MSNPTRKNTCRPRIGITMGDPAGVGPEIIIKALNDNRVSDCCRPVIFGDRTILEREAKKLTIPISLTEASCRDISALPSDRICLIEASQLNPADTQYGRPTKETGAAMAAYITQSVQAARDRTIDAVVTAPINKQSLHDAGYDFPGHTEMLAHLTGARKVVMMLAGETLRVVLVTIHCALTDVPSRLDSTSILDTLCITHSSLQQLFAIPEPRLAVAALNPHAGEGGLFGHEEETVIMPAIKEAQARGIAVTGPCPADTLFYYASQGMYDAVVCMYHDQGLIPLKLLHFEDGVNITLGLPIIRTSVDHGTAYDIAGTGTANPESMISAILMASRMARAAAIQK